MRDTAEHCAGIGKESDMGDWTIYAIVACVLAVLIYYMPKLIQVRVWITRKIHLFRLANWIERNSVLIVKVVRVILAAVILVLLLLMVGII